MSNKRRGAAWKPLVCVVLALAIVGGGMMYATQREVRAEQEAAAIQPEELTGDDKIVYDLFIGYIENLCDLAENNENIVFANGSQWRILSGTLITDEYVCAAILFTSIYGKSNSAIVPDVICREEGKMPEYLSNIINDIIDGKALISDMIELDIFCNTNGLNYDKINSAIDKYWADRGESKYSNEMTKDDRLAYEIILKSTYAFSDPSKVRIVSGSLWKPKQFLWAHLTTPSGYKGDISGYYYLDGKTGKAEKDNYAFPYSEKEKEFYLDYGLNFDRINAALEEYWKHN